MVRGWKYPRRHLLSQYKNVENFNSHRFKWNEIKREESFPKASSPFRNFWQTSFFWILWGTGERREREE